MKKVFIISVLRTGLFTGSGFAQTVLLSQGFETSDNLEDWGLIDADGDGNIWELFQHADFAHSGTTCVSSASFINGSGPLMPNNYLITCAIAIPDNGATLTWWIGTQDSIYFAEHYQVKVSITTNTSESNYTYLLHNETLTSYSWQQRSVSLNAFAGQTIYIAFIHNFCTDQFILKLDDILITAPQPTFTVMAAPSNAVYGSVTGGGTYNQGSQTTLTAILKANCSFITWSDGNT